MSEAVSPPISRPLKPGLLPALARVYADILRHQGRTTTQFVRWAKEGRRTHEFAWLGGELAAETLLSGKGTIKVSRRSPLFDAVQKMHAASTLNPYEREVFYGYPYVVGRRDGEPIRAPLLHLRVTVAPAADGYVIEQADDVVQVNLLPFRSNGDPDQHEQRLARVIAETPTLPLTSDSLQRLVATVTREFSYLTQDGALLDGSLGAVPLEPAPGENGLRLIDQAALFVAPKSSYFLASDLDHIAASEASVQLSALGALLAGGAGSAVELSDEAVDAAQVFFPFPSNRAQRRAAMLVQDDSTRVIRVEGPPGTGKSLTIANIASHLAATGKTVLISSQKDKALEVVDEKLAGLQMEELPMTLLHNDRESKNDLLRRLDRVRKERSEQEVAREFDRIAAEFAAEAGSKQNLSAAYDDALALDANLEGAHRAMAAADGLGGLLKRFGYWRAKSKATGKDAPSSAGLAEAVSKRRQRLLQLAEEALELGGELTVARASREERAGLRELSAVLKRDQARYKNFSLFDRMKADADRARMVLKLLPVWVMSPDDVARLFPCLPALFDVVIVDEASQVDLPSIFPVAFRGRKLVIFGDSKQMQPRRFAFMSQDVTRQAWQREGLDRLDPERWFHPSEQSLLTLAYMRSEEEVLLNEHFRSLPPIIQFSNQRWYDSQLRIMTDERQKKYGPPRQPIIELHPVDGGVLSNGSQENEVEASALVELLQQLIDNPLYAGASIGVMCLFDEQVDLVQEMVTQRVPEQAWLDHELVVINPDGFQGDERDVILYSLSYDAELMPQEALSARMSDQAHIQGMLNVAFTRARDEIHVFHSAPIEAFTFAGGRPGAITDWLKHGEKVEADPPRANTSSRPGEFASQFQADVASALLAKGLLVQHNYAACGLRIGLVVEDAALDVRLAVECDGERYSSREGLEEIERQDILERAGWRVHRIPYRDWHRGPEAETERVLDALRQLHSGEEDDAEVDEVDDEAAVNGREWVSREQRAVIEALKAGHTSEENLFLAARDHLEAARLTQKLRSSLRLAAADLASRGLIAIEDGEYFILEAGREARYATRRSTATAARRRY